MTSQPDLDPDEPEDYEQLWEDILSKADGAIERLQAVIENLPDLESLDNDATHPDRVFVSKVLPNED